jgi:hypothetical protein
MRTSGWSTGLLARLAPFDFVSRFVFDKQGFYEAYDGYSEGYRAHVVKVLSDTYLKTRRRSGRGFTD